MTTAKNEYQNKLVSETSPYLLQHANNPVNWYPWGEEAFNKAQEEDKPLIVSIGYSACHWCHVMEHESFEDEEVAQLMNDHYIPVKVDREERPDVDQLYIDAVSLMTGQAGWPLNVIVLPDGRPIFGGTYFPKPNWMEVLRKLNDIYTNQQTEALDYAKKLEEGIQSINLVEPPKSKTPIDQATIDQVFEKMENGFDTNFGGRQTAPKFPLPDNFLFFMRYYARTGKQEAWEQTDLTLTKMAQGGIYDQLGGGFARYSTDKQWKVPHFEKMLYDNAQLITAYSEAYQISQNPSYKNVVRDTIGFLKREMLSPEGGFYSALDADSENEEGKFYTWTKAQLEEVLRDDELQSLAKAYFGIDDAGLWENDKNILLVAKDEQSLANEWNMAISDVKSKLTEAKSLLFEARKSRVRPGLDDKILTSWNALTIKGLADAAEVFADKEYHELAKTNIDFLLNNLVSGDEVYRSFKEGEAKIEGFLDDYALLIQGLLHFYQLSFDEFYLNKANAFAEKAFSSFFDENAGLFQFRPNHQQALITQKFEIADNVIASPNSVMAKNLFYLGHYFEQDALKNRAAQMFQTISDQWQKQPYFFTNWGTLATHLMDDFYEVAIAGPDSFEKKKALQKAYKPHKVMAGSTEGNSELSLLKNRFQNEKTLIYVCQNKACKEPVENPDKALEKF